MKFIIAYFLKPFKGVEWRSWKRFCENSQDSICFSMKLLLMNLQTFVNEFFFFARYFLFYRYLYNFLFAKIILGVKKIQNKNVNNFVDT